MGGQEVSHPVSGLAPGFSCLAGERNQKEGLREDLQGEAKEAPSSLETSL